MSNVHLGYIRTIDEPVGFIEKRFFIKPTADYVPDNFDVKTYVAEQGIPVPEGFEAVDYKPAKVVFRQLRTNNVTPEGPVDTDVNPLHNAV